MAHLLHPFVDQSVSIVRARAGLRMELHRPRLLGRKREALHGSVVEGDVRDRLAAPAHRKAMVLGRNEYTPTRELENRMVGAAVAEGKLERLEPGRQGEELVPQADAEERYPAEQPRHLRDLGRERSRIAGSVREQDGVGPLAEDRR